MIKYKTEFGENRKILLIEEEKYSTNIMFECPNDIFDFCKNIIKMDKQTEEYAYCFCLDVKLNVLGFFEISHGTICNSLMSPREIFQKALMIGAVGIIISHNHPSSDPTPSDTDFNITEKIREAGRILDVELLEHIIIGDNNFYSFRESGFFDKF